MAYHRNIVAAAHGILTKTTDPSWPDRLRAFAWRDGYDAEVVPTNYFALGIPIVEVAFWNWFRARQLLADLEPFIERAEDPRINLVAHSNGGDIALRVARELWAKRRRVETLVLTNAAAEADVRANGVYRAVNDGLLGRAVAWCGRKDRLIASPAIWPYGHLGATGWTLDGKPFSQVPIPEDDHEQGIVMNVWHDEGHCHLFSKAERDNTFAAVLALCGCEREANTIGGVA